MSNEITAFFKGRKGVAESVYQFDYGMVLILDGIDLPENFDCYFSNEGDEEAIPVIGADNRVAIPNKCLSLPGTITAHIPSHTGINDSEVEYIVSFNVINRAKPVDDGTEKDQTAISKAIAALNHNNLPGLVPDVVTEWLDEHPEATTTVQDGSIEEIKLHPSLSQLVNNKATKFNRPLRFLQISDTHYASNPECCNMPPEERFNRMVDWIVEEHSKKPLDFIIHTGDITYSNLYTEGESTNYLAKFFNEFAWKFPCPIYTVAGNHDGYTDEQFKAFAGTPRQYTVECEDVVLVMLDVFGMPSGTSYGGSYQGASAEYLQHALDLDTRGEKKFIVFAHWFDRNADSQEFKDLVDNDDRILYLVRGHSHKYAVTNYGNKNLVTGQHIAFWMDGSSATWSYNSEIPWAYQIHELTDDGITVQNIQPAGIYYDTSFNKIEYEGLTSEPTVVADGEPIETYDFRLSKDSVNNVTFRVGNAMKSVDSFKNATVIMRGTDLDSLHQEGLYRSYSSSYTNTLLNCPITGAGFTLQVRRNTKDSCASYATAHIKQILFPASGRNYAYQRDYNYNNNAWSDWVVIGDEYKFVTDLNDVVGGAKRFAVYAYSNTTSNRPSSSGGMMVTIGDSVYFYQVAFANSSSNTTVFIRHHGSSGFGSWKTLQYAS